MTSRHSSKIIQQILSSHRTRPFRIPTPSQCCPSSRALSSSLRKQTNHATIRCALACEASSLRYSLFMEDGEDGLLRGWDAGVDEEDDGTWVIVWVYCCWSDFWQWARRGLVIFDRNLTVHAIVLIIFSWFSTIPNADYIRHVEHWNLLGKTPTFT